MEIIFLQPQRVAMPDGSRDFRPGDTITLPDVVAQRLMTLVPGKVKMVDKPQIQPGVWVEFSSPLFGMVTAKIVSVDVEHLWITSHSVLKGTDEPVRIPVAWVCGVYSERFNQSTS